MVVGAMLEPGRDGMVGDFFQKLRKDVEQSLRQLPRNAADD